MQKLIVIRGPSGSGKSTVARNLSQMCVHPPLLISEDQIRRMFVNHTQEGHEVAKRLATKAVLFGLDNGYDVIYEGILNLKTSGDNLQEFFDAHTEENYLFYLDVGFEETIRRHKTRDKIKEFDHESMKKWWDFASPTGLISETIIPESTTLEDTVNFISRTAKLKIRESEKPE
jgi:adenylate kinase family enzyme